MAYVVFWPLSFQRGLPFHTRTKENMCSKFLFCTVLGLVCLMNTKSHDEYTEALRALKELSPNVLMDPDYRRAVGLKSNKLRELVKFNSKLNKHVQLLSSKANENSSSSLNNEIVTEINSAARDLKEELVTILEEVSVERVRQLRTQVLYKTCWDASHGITRMSDLLLLSDEQVSQLHEKIPAFESETAEKLLAISNRFREFQKDVFRRCAKAVPPEIRKEWLGLLGEDLHDSVRLDHVLLATESQRNIADAPNGNITSREFMLDLKVGGVEWVIPNLYMTREQLSVTKPIGKEIKRKIFDFAKKHFGSSPTLASLDKMAFEEEKQLLIDEVESLRAELLDHLLPHQRTHLIQLAARKAIKPNVANLFGLAQLIDRLDMDENLAKRLEELDVTISDELKLLSNELQSSFQQFRMSTRGKLLDELSVQQQSRYLDFVGEEVLTRIGIVSLQKLVQRNRPVEIIEPPSDIDE